MASVGHITVPVRFAVDGLDRAYAAEHQALHDYIVGRLLNVDPRELHERYGRLIAAHDTVAAALPTPPPSPVNGDGK